jgi:hypothetical protein
MAADKIWLDVPYAEKGEAKAQGARWDSSAGRWYAPRPGMTALDRWQASPDVPDLLPGEDRSLGSGLFVDLVPSSCWFTNVRSCVSQRDWERLRKMVTDRASKRCEICQRSQDRESARWLEVHERWSFDDSKNVQTLRRLICVCTDCHTTTHFGLATVNGKEKEALRHLCAVTGMLADEARRHIDEAFTLWRARSRRVWELDLGILGNAGIAVLKPPAAADRAHAAEQV